MRVTPLELAVLKVLERAEKPLSARDVRDRLKERDTKASEAEVETVLEGLRARLLAEWGRQRRYPVVEITRAGRTVAKQGETS